MRCWGHRRRDRGELEGWGLGLAKRMSVTVDAVTRAAANAG